MTLTELPKVILFLTLITVLTILSIPNDAKMGIIYFNSFKYDEALYYFDKSKSQNIASIPVLKKLKDYFVIHGNISKATNIQLKLTQVLPKNIEFKKDLSQLYTWGGFTYKALKVDEEIISLNKDNKSYYDELIRILNGYLWLKKYPDAKRIGRLLFESKSPKVLEVNLAYLLSVQNVDGVINNIRKIEKVNPEKIHLKKYLAQAYEIKGETKNALISYLAYFANSRDGQQFYQNPRFLENHTAKSIDNKYKELEKIQYLYAELNDKKSNAQINERLFDFNPNEYDRAYDAAEYYSYVPNKKKTLSILAKLSTIRSASRQYRAALIYERIENFELAIKHYENSIRLNKRRIQYYQSLSNLYERLGYTQKALNIQYRILKTFKRRSTFNVNQFETLFVQNKGKLKSNKIISQVQKKILYLLQKLKRHKSYEKELEKFYKKNPYNFDIKYQYALLLQKNKKTDAANILFRELIEQNPYHQDLNMTLSELELTEQNYALALDYAKRIKRNTVYKKALLYQVYLKTDLNKARALCKEMIRSKNNLKSFTHTDLKTNCLIDEKQMQDAANILYKFIRKHPKHRDAKFKLAYLLLDMNKIQRAKKIVTSLKSNSNLNEQRLLQLESDYHEKEIYLSRKLAWEQQYSLNYTSNDLGFSFISHDYQLIKKSTSFYAGINRSNYYASNLAEGSFETSIVLGANLSQNKNIEFMAGINQGRTKSTYLSASLNHSPSQKLFYRLSSQLNKAVYEFENLNKLDESKKDTISAYFEYYIETQHYIELFAKYSVFHAENHSSKDEATIQTLNLQYNKKLYENWTYGLRVAPQSAQRDFLYENIFAKNGFGYALNLRHRNKVFNKYSHQFDFYLGGDSAREINFGDFYNIQEGLEYNYNRSSKIFIRAGISSEKSELPNNKTTTISLGFNNWF